MRDYELFIGADNSTGIVDIHTVKLILGEYLRGWTILPAKGAWDWHEEGAVVVTVHDGDSPDPDAVRMRILETLCAELRQEAIGWREALPMRFFAPAMV